MTYQYPANQPDPPSPRRITEHEAADLVLDMWRAILFTPNGTGDPVADAMETLIRAARAHPDNATKIVTRLIVDGGGTFYGMTKNHDPHVIMDTILAAHADT